MGGVPRGYGMGTLGVEVTQARLRVFGIRVQVQVRLHVINYKGIYTNTDTRTYTGTHTGTHTGQDQVHIQELIHGWLLEQIQVRIDTDVDTDKGVDTKRDVDADTDVDAHTGVNARTGVDAERLVDAPLCRRRSI